MSVVQKVVSGGQTGVDQAALRAAAELGVEIGGWCPPDRACEGGTIPASFPLTPTPDERSVHGLEIPRSQRTEWNVRDSDGSLIIRPRVERATDPGTSFTEECAIRLGRPFFVVRTAIGGTADQDVDAVRRWLRLHRIGVLNVAGPSEGDAPGIGDHAHALMLRILAPGDDDDETMTPSR